MSVENIAAPGEEPEDVTPGIGDQADEITTGQDAVEVTEGGDESVGQDASQQPAPAQASIAERLRALGLPAQGDDDESALQVLANNYRQVRELAAFGHQVRPQFAQFQEWQRQQAAQLAQQQAPPVQKKARKYEPIEYDPSWESQVTRTEDGRLVPRDMTVDPQVAQKLAKYQEAARERLAAMALDPHAFVGEVFGDDLEQRFQTMLDERLAQEAARQQDFGFARQTIASSQDWMFVKDANGNPLIDPTNGSRIPTQECLVYAKAVSDANSAGVTDSRMQHEIGMGRVKMFEMQSQQRQQHQPQAPGRRQPQINPAVTRTPNRNGSVQAAESQIDFSQNPSQSLLQSMLRDARERGLDLSATA